MPLVPPIQHYNVDLEMELAVFSNLFYVIGKIRYYGQYIKEITPIPSLDEIDRKILDRLQEDGRLTIVELAEHVGLSPSPCLRRVRILEETGIISRYVALVDQKRVGLPVSVFISIKLERQREEELDRFESEVSQYPEVLECYLMTGTRDYLLRIVARDLDAYERFLKDKLTRIHGVASIESSFALKQVKYSNSLPLGPVGPAK